ncbi:hypothetical protein [Arthrobacter sp. U41]|uniref:hypothetical protein n=1 Tax=Arthrobacter sp. U41 TaxID=1849032 RepID=UPI00085963C0|nr:hypothetical protein [Arthrobacter sp. U41]AOT05811.1 hypothetical protein ASPU41_20470 [Arthrobacter sp. U41]
MKRYIRGLSSRAIYTAFGVAYGLALVMALFPPLYLSASGVATPILGIPFAIAYWIFDALLVGLALWALYAAEDIRGELDDEPEALHLSSATTPTMKDIR